MKYIKVLAKYFGIKEEYLALFITSLTIGWLSSYFLYFGFFGLTHTQAQFALFPRWYNEPEILSGIELKYVAIIHLSLFTLFNSVISYVFVREYGKNSNQNFFLFIKYFLLLVLISSLVYLPLLYAGYTNNNPW